MAASALTMARSEMAAKPSDHTGTRNTEHGRPGKCGGHVPLYLPGIEEAKDRLESFLLARDRLAIRACNTFTAGNTIPIATRQSSEQL